MNERDNQTIKYINKHYEDLLEEVKLIGNFEEFKKGGVLTKAIKMDILQIAENVNCLTEEAASKLNKKRPKRHHRCSKPYSAWIHLCK